MQIKKIFKSVFSEKLRARKNLSDMAREMKISRNSMQLWSEGKTMPSRENCTRLVNEYGFEYSDFFLQAEVSDDLLD